MYESVIANGECTRQLSGHNCSRMTMISDAGVGVLMSIILIHQKDVSYHDMQQHRTTLQHRSWLPKAKHSQSKTFRPHIQTFVNTHHGW